MGGTLSHMQACTDKAPPDTADEKASSARNVEAADLQIGCVLGANSAQRTLACDCLPPDRFPKPSVLFPFGVVAEPSHTSLGMLPCHAFVAWA